MHMSGMRVTEGGCARAARLPSHRVRTWFLSAPDSRSSVVCEGPKSAPSIFGMGRFFTALYTRLYSSFSVIMKCLRSSIASGVSFCRKVPITAWEKQGFRRRAG